MTILFMGGEMGAFVPSDANTIENTGETDVFDAAFSRCSIEMSGSTSYCESADFAASHSLWVHFAIGAGNGSGTSSTVKILALANAAGTNLARVNVNYASSTSHTVSLEYWNGASFTSVGSFTINMTSTIHHMDLQVVGNSGTGSMALYVAGTERITTGSIDMSSVASLTNVRSYGRASNSDMHISQVIVADESTIGWRLATFYPSGAGATSSWTGAYTSIDEPVFSDADFILSSVADQVSTFAQTGPVMTGYTVKAVAVAARAKRGASGPANLQLALRSAGTTYFSGSKALDLGITANVGIWETDPATTAAWVNTAISSLQPGVKSIT
jgi:hypothetical protein